MSFLSGKIALVTGSTSGIGLAIAKALAQQGVHVMMNGFGEKEAALAEIKACGVEVDYHGADMSKPKDIEDLILTVEKRFGAIDILVNNAGIQHVDRSETGVETVALVNALNAPIMNRFSSAKSFAPSIEEIRNHPELVAKYQSEGKRVFVWTVNDVIDLKLCAQLGVDVVITDMPARAVSELGYP